MIFYQFIRRKNAEQRKFQGIVNNIHICFINIILTACKRNYPWLQNLPITGLQDRKYILPLQRTNCTVLLLVLYNIHHKPVNGQIHERI